jgi:hypothetical protein
MDMKHLPVLPKEKSLLSRFMLKVVDSKQFKFTLIELLVVGSMQIM